jgi:hypothetical protein
VSRRADSKVHSGYTFYALVKQRIVGVVMVAIATRRWGIWLAVIAAALVICAWALGISLIPLTPERARAALAARFPELVNAAITSRGQYVLIGEYECDLVERTWGHTSNGVVKYGNQPHNTLGVVWVTRGTFENPFFIHWRASAGQTAGVGGGVIVP